MVVNDVRGVGWGGGGGVAVTSDGMMHCVLDPDRDLLDWSDMDPENSFRNQIRI
jgi:hypothetical protein